MTIDIHKLITGNPITNNLMKPWGSNAKPNSLRGKLFNRYTGPGNPVQDQVDFNPYTGQIYKVYDPPSSKNDRCSMIHDVKYTVAENIGKDSKDIKNRKLDADKEWLDCFKPRTPYDILAYSAIKSKKSLGLGNNPNEILSQELHKPKRVNFERRRVISNHIDHIWGIDLVTMIKYSKQNNNYKYILTVIDFFSKHSWCYPLKNKNYNEIINSFKDIFKKSKRKPKMIQSDEGSEFTNKQVQKFFNDNNIKWYHTYNRDIKCSICERFNRTILNKIYKNFTLNNNTNWIKDLNKLVKEYNNSYHRTIKMKPVDASKKSNENIVRKNYNFEIITNKKKFKIGDKVRISLLKNTFEKGYTSNWSEQIYVIYDIKSSNVHYYYLKDLNGEKLDGTFYQEELLKTNINDNDFYVIEKIIKKVGNKYLVKWRGYDYTFNSYVNENDIVKYV